MSTTVKWGSEQTLNPGHRTLVTLSDGRLFGIYEVNPGTSGSSSTLFGQFYGADGTQIGTAFVVDSLYQGAYRNAVAEVLDDGRFVVGWSGNNGGDGWGTNNLGYRILNADGTQSGPAVNLLNSNFTTVVEITAIGDGRFVFDGAGYVGTPNLVSNIGRVHQVFDADGSAVSQPNLVFGGSSVFANLPVATQPLSDGGYVSVGQVYTGGSGFVSSTQLLGRAFNSDGSPRGAEFEVSGTDHTRSDVQLEVLADGRMVAIWKATGPSDSPWGPGWSYSSDAELRGQVFYADGTKSGAEFVVNTTTEGLQDMPSLTALHDGRFLVAWQDFGVGSTPLANLQAFNPDGSKSGLEFSVTSPDSLSQSWPKLETLADGRVVLSWHSWEGSTLLNKFQMLDPRQGPVTLNGEVTADHLVGTRWADVINGGFGNDVLAGGNGNDTVYGEWGNDTLKGDAGNDRLYGGAGNDSLHGGVGSDELWAGDGNDTLDGGAGNDALIGGLGNDTYIVNSLLDLVIENANEGTDTVSSNNISLNLSNYAEVENASLTGSRLLNLTGSLGNNVLMGNVGANLIDGGAGNDTLNGGSGNDTLVGGLGTDSMTGGAGVDLFRFLTVSDSVGSTATTRDVISDFQRGIDKIDLAAIDASLTLAGDQAFTFIGTAAFSGTGGAQVRYVGGILSGNVNGDLVADFQIQLVGSPAITATDIIL